MEDATVSTTMTAGNRQPLGALATPALNHNNHRHREPPPSSIGVITAGGGAGRDPTASSSSSSCRTLPRTSRSFDHSYRYRMHQHDEKDDISLDHGDKLGLNGERSSGHSSAGEPRTLSTAVASLHSSFDAALNDEQKDSIFRLCRSDRRSTSVSSWDEATASSDPALELSGKKHLRQHAPTISLPPGTVRKLPRRSSSNPPPPDAEPILLISRNTPARSFSKNHRPPPTPISSSTGVLSSSVPRRRTNSFTTSNTIPKSPFRKLPHYANTTTTPRFPAIGTPTRATPLISKPKGPHTCQTSTTANTSSTDVTVDESTVTEEAQSPSSTPFRFTSFPASLPRVQPRPIVPASSITPATLLGHASTLQESGGFVGPSAPQTVRKRMTFSKVKTAASAAEGDADTSMAKKPLYLSSSYSRDEEGTQNSSISSVSGGDPSAIAAATIASIGGGVGIHGGLGSSGGSFGGSAAGGGATSILPQAPSFPPPILEWKSPDFASSRHSLTATIDPKYSEEEGSQDHDNHFHRRGTTAIHTKLFLDETIDEIGYSHDTSPTKSEGAEDAEACPRTRLDFNMLLSPADKGTTAVQTLNLGAEKCGDDDDDDDDFQAAAFVHRRLDNNNSIKTSPLRIANNNSSINTSDGMDCTGSISALTPNRPGMVSNGGPHSGHFPAPPTPDEVHFHFHVDGAQCSPIPGIPEEGEMDLESNSPHNNNGSNHQASTSSTPRPSSADSTALPKLDLSQQSSDSSNSSSKLRKFRPMPDMSAFDGCASIKSSGTSSHNRSSEDGSTSAATNTHSQQQQQPQLLCPPTPVRTPAWAHSDNSENPFLRANSLIVTKVLATCPTQVMDGHSSLENSLMEDDHEQQHQHHSSIASATGTRASLSFSTVAEEGKENEVAEHNSNGDINNNVGSVDESFDPDNSFTSLQGSTRRDLVEEAGVTGLRLPKTPHIQRGGGAWPAPRLLSTKSGEMSSVISFVNNFENLGQLGSGAFADVFKVRSRVDGQLYAVKRNRRQFRGKRDRDLAMTEVRIMQKLQNVCASAVTSASDENTCMSDQEQSGRNNRQQHLSDSSKTLYLLFFYRAWQEEGYFFCQTELCCRDTCRELMESLKLYWEDASRKYPSLLVHLAPTELEQEQEGAVDMMDGDRCVTGRLLPEPTLWKICHDVSAGLSHIHSQGIVHHDIKPSNIFFVSHPRFGAMCKIGDFGIAGATGTSDDGQEGDTFYMAPELLSSSSVKHPSADMFSLGLTLYELAASIDWELPVDGPRWHEVRSGSHVPELPSSRSPELRRLIQRLIRIDSDRRPSADSLLHDIPLVKEAGIINDFFLHDYIHDVEELDRIREARIAQQRHEADQVGFTPRAVLHVDEVNNNRTESDTATNAVMMNRELRTPKHPHATFSSPSMRLPQAPVLFTPDVVNK